MKLCCKRDQARRDCGIKTAAGGGDIIRQDSVRDIDGFLVIYWAFQIDTTTFFTGRVGDHLVGV